MRVFRQYSDLPPSARGAVVALGNFDGVHLGHQAVIAAARERADEMGTPLGVVVFEPHPREVLSKTPPEPFRLTPLPVKARILGDLGVDFVYAVPFTRDLAALTAADFVLEVIVGGLQAVHVVTGYDFRFGQARGGDDAVLAWMGEAEGFGVTVAARVQSGDGTVYSSTEIRKRLREGDPRGAAALMGRPWRIDGQVIAGDARGRTIGFPTANVAMEDYLEPALGVYAVELTVRDGRHKGTYPAVANLGRKPTFGTNTVGLEAHLFDFEGDLYGCAVSVEMIDFIRAERRFDGIDALKAQIAEDAARARGILAVAQPGKAANGA